MSTEERQPKKKAGRPKGSINVPASFRMKRERKDVLTSLERSEWNPVPSGAVTGAEMSWDVRIPPGPQAKGQSSKGRVARPFDRRSALKLQRIVKEMKAARSDKASQIAIEALRMSSELIDEGHRKLIAFGEKKGTSYWDTILDYVEWCYMQGYAHYDPTDIVRWDARCSDRLLSCELYHLTLLARYLRLTFIELITPTK